MKLREARKMFCLTVAYCASRCGVGESAWRYWENGDKDPTAENKKAIFLLFNGAVRPDDFYPVAQWQAELEARNAPRGAKPLPNSTASESTSLA